MLPKVTFDLRPDRVAATPPPQEEPVKVDQASDQGVSLGGSSRHIHPGGNPGAD